MSNDNYNKFSSNENMNLLSVQAPLGDKVNDPVVVLSANAYCHDGDFEYGRSLKRGSGILCGVLGCLIGGPILAIITGVGAACAIEKEGLTGDIARAAGEIALSVQNKAKEVDEKHKLRSGKASPQELYPPK